MKKSLQQIEDYYIQKGLRGYRLRILLEKDAEYQRLLKERRRKLTKRLKVKEKDLQRYVLSTDQDYEILGKIYQLEGKELSEDDRKLVKFIRTQLEHDWREALLNTLRRLLKGYHIKN